MRKERVTKKMLERIDKLMDVTRVPLWHPTAQEGEYDASNNYLRLLELIDYIPILKRDYERLLAKAEEATK